MKILFALLAKDLKCIARGRSLVMAVLSFALLVVVASSFAFRAVGLGEEPMRLILPGILWLDFLFAAVVVLNHTLVLERESAAMPLMAAALEDTAPLFLAKFLSNVLFLIAVQVVVFFGAHLFFSIDIFSLIAPFLVLLLLAAIGVSALGTLLAGISSASGGREILLPLLLFPLLLPLLAALVTLSRSLLITSVLPVDSFWFVFLCIFDVVSLTLGWALFDAVGRE